MRISRRHLAGVWRRIIGRPGAQDDSREAMRYRAAALMILAAIGFTVYLAYVLEIIKGPRAKGEPPE